MSMLHPEEIGLPPYTTDMSVDTVLKLLRVAGNHRWVDMIESERKALAARVAELEKDAAFGRIAMRFVDRAGDYCPQDPAERICDEFEAAIAAEVDRQAGEILTRRRKGLPDADGGKP